MLIKMLKKGTLLLSIIVLFSLPCFALDVNISIKDSFGVGESTSFNYSLISDVDQEVTYLPYITCPKGDMRILEERKANLTKLESYTGSYHGIIISDYIEPQICFASMEILSPIKQTIVKRFQITTDPSFSFDIKLDKKIFILGENIYLDYTSDAENPSITSTLTYPDKTTKIITLPTSIKASQVGTYELDVTASKEGYKTITKKEQFGVIKDQANIKTISSSDLVESQDGNFSKKETEDKKDFSKFDRSLIPFLIKIASGLFLAVLILVIWSWIKSKDKNQTPKN